MRMALLSITPANKCGCRHNLVSSARDEEAAFKIIAGTARQMGLEIVD